jgi:hypothetical protein
MEWQHLETFSFGDGPDLANRLLELVLSGTKRATCWAESQGLLSAEVRKWVDRGQWFLQQPPCGSLAMFAAMRHAIMSGIGGSAKVRDLRSTHDPERKCGIIDAALEPSRVTRREID